MVINMPDLSVNIGQLNLKNPVMVASGTFGYGIEYEGLFDLSRLGAIIAKTITLEPAKGNPPPRIVEVTGGILNSIGLQNEGVDDFIKNKIPKMKEFGVPIIANIAGKTVKEYKETAQKLDSVSEVSAIEINVSCPNVKEGGIAFGIDPKWTSTVVKNVCSVTKKTVITKLTPNVTDIVNIAAAAVDAGSDALSLINTFKAMAIDVNTRKPKLASITGGLSGPGIKPIALRMVWEVASVVKVPIIGIGGIVDAGDALEFIIAGASAVAVGTANYINPKAAIEIIDGLENYLAKNNIADIKQLIGSLKRE